MFYLNLNQNWMYIGQSLDTEAKAVALETRPSAAAPYCIVFLTHNRLPKISSLGF